MTDTTRSSQYSVGDTVSLDGIECLIVYAAETEQSWGRYIVTDKNHDLCWYFDGSDYEDESEESGVINNANKYGYEWGGYDNTTSITDTFVGSGLTNTNSLISMNLQPRAVDWSILWDKVEEFRETCSDKWFVPSRDELNLIYTNRNSLNGLTTINNSNLNPYYWSSSEYGAYSAWCQGFAGGDQINDYKYLHNYRTRLCRYATDADLNPPQIPIEITCETEGAGIRYTLDGSDPTEESMLYIGQFEVTPPVIIKARGYKEGMLASDVASYEVEAPAVPVTVPMALPDGSVLFYDRGTSYGKYKINDSGYPERMDSASDDGSAESQNWRYLICDQHDLDNGTFQWGPYGTNEGMTDVKYEDMGYGLPNTNAMIAKYATNTSYWWRLIKEKRDNTGLNWFMPSKDELDMMYDNRTVITGQGGDAFKTDTWYWSSSERTSYNAWYQTFSNGYQNYFLKNSTGRCRLLRRV